MPYEGDDDGKGAEDHFVLLDKVKDFCLSSGLEEDFEAWAREHWEVFGDAVEEGSWTAASQVEHKLEFMDLYNQFLTHFEEKISSFIEEEGGTTGEFQRQCQEVLEDLDEFSSRRFFIEVLLATTDYDRFFHLMVGEARRNQRERSARK